MFTWLINGALAEEAAETAAASEPGWLQKAFEKFAETPWTVWIAVAVLVALGAVFLVITRTSRKWTAKMLSFGALSIALSFVLSCVRLYRMPTGGSVTPASMLPIMLFSAAYGVGPGLLTGLVYGVLQYFQGGWFLNVWQMILDYLLAFAALGLAGLARKLPEKWGLYCAMVIAVLARALSAILAGIMWANDSIAQGWGLEIAGKTYNSPVLYSVVYNGTYLIPEIVICILLAFAIAKPVMRIMKNELR